MINVEVPTKRYIRKRIFFDGSKNAINSWDDEIASKVIGVSVKSHISFIKQTHRSVAKYKEAKGDLKAASFTLSIVMEYAINGQDPLFKLYWEVYQCLIMSGLDEYIDQCKEILQFVKYPEGKDLVYSQYTYSELLSLAKYKDIKEYPPTYIMYYDIINEFDLKLSEDRKKEHEIKYALEFLSDDIYESEHTHDLPIKLEKSMRVVKTQLSRRKIDEIRNCILNSSPIVNRESYISNAICALGRKREDFYPALTNGVTEELFPTVDNDFAKIERLYSIELERPEIKPTGVQEHEYHVQMIVREDPKKERDAFSSNPVKDTIGFVGMDILAHIFMSCPWIQCGRKRDTDTDMLIDKHRFEEIKKVYLYNKLRGRSVVSTDLSKATEHLNMITSMKIIKRLLLVITGLPSEIVERWVQDTFSQLYTTGMTLQHYPTNGVFYTKAGQLQGMPGSFHAMTIVLALISLQACLDSGINEYEAIYSIQNNGDDGTLPSQAFDQYKILLEKLTGPGIVNPEKSFSTNINQSLEFCKTIYYANNEPLITGYRFSTVYKMLSSPSALIHTVEGTFEREKYIFSHIANNYSDLIDVDIEDPMTIIAWEFYKESFILERTLELDAMKNLVAIHKLMFNLDVNTFDPYQRAICPESWKYLLHSRKSYLVEDDLLWSDMKVIRDYIYQNEDSILEYPEYTYYLATDNEYELMKTSLCHQYGLNPNNLGYTINESSTNIESHIQVLPTPLMVRDQLGLSEDSDIILEPRFATNIKIKKNIEDIFIAELIQEESVEKKCDQIRAHRAKMRTINNGNTDVSYYSKVTIGKSPSNIQRNGYNWPKQKTGTR